MRRLTIAPLLAAGTIALRPCRNLPRPHGNTRWGSGSRTLLLMPGGPGNGDARMRGFVRDTKAV